MTIRAPKLLDKDQGRACCRLCSRDLFTIYTNRERPEEKYLAPVKLICGECERGKQGERESWR